MEGGKVFSFGVGPLILLGTCDVKRTRGYEGEELVLVDGDQVFVVGVGFELVAEPVGEGAIDDGGSFAEATSGEGGSAFAGIVGDDDGEALVLGAGPEGGFAEAGVTEDGDVTAIDGGVLFEIIEGAGESPGPGSDAAPVGGLPLSVRAIRTELGADAVFPAFGMVGFEVAAIDCGDAEAGLDDEVDGPAAGGGAAGGFCGAVVFDAFFFLVAHPALGDADIGVGLDGVIAAEVESEEGGDGSFRVGRGIEEEVEVGGLVVSLEVDPDFLAFGEAV